MKRHLYTVYSITMSNFASFQNLTYNPFIALQLPFCYVQLSLWPHKLLSSHSKLASTCDNSKRIVCEVSRCISRLIRSDDACRYISLCIYLYAMNKFLLLSLILLTLCVYQGRSECKLYLTVLLQLIQKSILSNQFQD